MRRNYFPIKSCLSFMLLYGVLLFSCKKKKFDDALPEVVLESVEMVSLDSVVLTGNITSSGASAIEYSGFSFDKNPSFAIVQNQVLFEGDNTGTFKKVIHAEHDSIYYFKAFAANGFGYKESNVIQFKVPRPAPVVAPCTLTNNYFNDDGYNFPVSAYGSANFPSYGNYEVNLYGSSEDIALFFPYKPINGIYTTVLDGSNIGPGQVFIHITRFYNYYVNNGGKVYVNVDSTGTTSISICGVQYTNNSNNYTLKGKASFN